MNVERKIAVMMGSFLTLGCLTAAAVEQGTVGSEARDKCCFENSRYAGVCVVQPAEEETCASILEYLNDPVSSGKSYCGFTEIRGGWKEVACEEGSGGPRASVSEPIPVRVGAGQVDDIPSNQTLEEAYPECWN